MRSCKFDNLPLQEVSCSIKFRESTPVTFDLVTRLFQEVGGIFTSVIRVCDSGSDFPFSLNMGHEPGAILADNSKNLILRLQPDRLSVGWQLGLMAPRYPGFISLLKALGECSKFVGTRTIESQSISYVNRDTSEASIGTMIQIPGVSSELIDSVLEWNVARTLDSGIEHRLQIAGPQGNRLVITTGWRSYPRPPDFIEDLEQIHDLMQDQFEVILTEKSKHDWKYRGVQ